MMIQNFITKNTIINILHILFEITYTFITSLRAREGVVPISPPAVKRVND